MSNVLDHVHTYHRIKYGKEFVWKCDHPQCSHFAREAIVKGKPCVCYKCGVNTFLLTADKMRRVRPKCDACQGIPVTAEEVESPISVSDVSTVNVGDLLREID